MYAFVGGTGVRPGETQTLSRQTRTKTRNPRNLAGIPGPQVVDPGAPGQGDARGLTQVRGEFPFQIAAGFRADERGVDGSVDEDLERRDGADLILLRA